MKIGKTRLDLHETFIKMKWLNILLDNGGRQKSYTCEEADKLPANINSYIYL